MDRGELAIALGFGLLSMWVLGVTLWQVAAHGRMWTGTDGMFVTDQMTYLGWMQDASRHGLTSNLFQIHQTPADFFQPLIFISGRVVALGVAPWIVLLAWKPIAVGGVAFAATALVHRTLDGTWARRSALALGLFFVGPGAVLAAHLLQHDPAARLQWSAITFDTSLGFWSWGYTFGLISLACALLSVVSYDRARRDDQRQWLPGLLGALSGALHPWQGATALAVILVSEALGTRRSRRPNGRLLAGTLTATALPLLYFSILNRSDPSWGLAQSSAHSAVPLWMVGVTLSPLLLPAAIAYTHRPTDFMGLATRLWPIAALAIFLLSETSLSAAPTHALLGSSIPLSVLAVDGVRRLRIQRRTPAIALAVLSAVVLLPPIWWELKGARDAVINLSPADSAVGARFVTAGERSALDYLTELSEPGGVLSRFYLGTDVPGITGRHTWVGNFYYSPQFARRVLTAEALFAGHMTAAQARQTVVDSAARFVLIDCQVDSTRIEVQLAPLVRAARHFGCAAVLRVH